MVWFWGTTLTSVARFLQSHEPYLPSNMTGLRHRHEISRYYEDQDVGVVMKLNKLTYKKLKSKKSKGCEIFKQCLVHHNARSHFKIYICLNEPEKIDLKSHGNSTYAGVHDSWPNPLGPLNTDNDNSLHELYRLPILNPERHSYLAPSFRKKDPVCPHVLGFCYEYGLGVKKRPDQAFKIYEKASAKEYSACYNLGRMLFQKGQYHQGIDYLIKGENMLMAKIKEAQQAIFDAKVGNAPDLQDIEAHHSSCIKRWRKGLKKIYIALMRTYQGLGDNFNADRYAQKYFVIPP